MRKRLLALQRAAIERASPAGGMMSDQDLAGLDVIVPNLHWRYSGVTATNRMIAPRVSALVRAAWLGGCAGENHRSFWDLLRLQTSRAHAAHLDARRNNEMIAGCCSSCCWPLRLFHLGGHAPYLDPAFSSPAGTRSSRHRFAASYLRRPATVFSWRRSIFYPVGARAAHCGGRLPGKSPRLLGRVRPQKGTDVRHAMCRLLRILRFRRGGDLGITVATPVRDNSRAARAAAYRNVSAFSANWRSPRCAVVPAQHYLPFTSRNEVLAHLLKRWRLPLPWAARAGAAESVIDDGATACWCPATSDALFPRSG